MLGLLYFFVVQWGTKINPPSISRDGLSGPTSGGFSGGTSGGFSGTTSGGISGYTSGGVGGETLPNPFGIYTIQDLIDRIINALIVIAIPLVAIMVMYGAYKIVLSQGDPKKVKEGRDIIIWAAVGFAIL